VFSKLINLTGLTQLPVSNFTMVGYGWFLSGLFWLANQPLPIAEITGGYSLMLPLMIVASIQFCHIKTI
jgi:CIC family chloride channel protein